MGSSVHGIFQVRILEWVDISYFRGSCWPRDRTQVTCISCIGRWILYHKSHLGSLYIIYIYYFYFIASLQITYITFLVWKCKWIKKEKKTQYYSGLKQTFPNIGLLAWKVVIMGCETYTLKARLFLCFLPFLGCFSLFSVSELVKSPLENSNLPQIF